MAEYDVLVIARGPGKFFVSKNSCGFVGHFFITSGLQAIIVAVLPRLSTYGLKGSGRDVCLIVFMRSGGNSASSPFDRRTSAFSASMTSSLTLPDCACSRAGAIGELPDTW